MTVIEILQNATAPQSAAEISEAGGFGAKLTREQIAGAVECGAVRIVDGKYYWLFFSLPTDALPPLPHRAAYPAEAAEVAKRLRAHGVQARAEGVYVTKVDDPLGDLVSRHWPQADPDALAGAPRTTTFAARRHRFA